MNIKLAGITALSILLLSGSAFAQGNPGAHFIENWDQDGDGVVTLEEVKEKRGDVFYMFDQGEDGFLSADDYVLFDETREADMAMEMEANGNGGGQQGGGNGGGQGRNGGGQGGGQGGQGGHGGGQGSQGGGQGGQGNQHRGAEGMTLEFNDKDGDGQVSMDEFISSADEWFATMDRDGDGALSPADFGRPS